MVSRPSISSSYFGMVYPQSILWSSENCLSYSCSLNPLKDLWQSSFWSSCPKALEWATSACPGKQFCSDFKQNLKTHPFKLAYTCWFLSLFPGNYVHLHFSFMFTLNCMQPCSCYMDMLALIHMSLILIIIIILLRSPLLQWSNGATVLQEVFSWRWLWL